MFAHLLQRPGQIRNCETAIFPVSHGLRVNQAIHIDCHVDRGTGNSLNESLEMLLPIFAQDCSAAFLIRGGSMVSPWMHFQTSLSFGSPISENLTRPPAFKIPAAPHAHLLNLRQLKRPIDPSAAGPLRRPNIPVRMIIKRDNGEGLSPSRTSSDSANPQCSEIMEIPGAVHDEVGKLWLNFLKEAFDQSRRRGES